MYCYISLFLFVSNSVVEAVQNSGFNSAWASSTFAASEEDGDALYDAMQAINSESGYWCSAGSHTTAQLVTWTGTLETRQLVQGVKISWSYAPGEFKILSSSDGSNYEEVACWRTSSRLDGSYEENVMFAEPRAAVAITIVMRSPRSYGYFGINSAMVISEASPLMIVAGPTSSTGDHCIVSTRRGEVIVEPCLGAIAAGDGREIFIADDQGHLSNVAGDRCIVLADGSTLDGGRIVMQDCASASAANDGRHKWQSQPDGQLQLANLGGYCLHLSARDSTKSLSVRKCQDTNHNDSNTFVLTRVPEFDPNRAENARAAAGLFTSSAQRLGRLLADVRAAVAEFGTCEKATSVARFDTRFSGSLLSNTLSRAATSRGPALKAIVAIMPQLGVDMDHVHKLMHDCDHLMSDIRKD